MSQEKIDAYKKEKSGRKERIAKQKKRNKILKITGIIAGAAIVIAIAGAIVWNRVEASNAAAEAAAAETEVSTETDTTSESEAEPSTETETSSESETEASAEESTAATEDASAETSAE